MSQEPAFRPVDEQVGYVLKKAASSLRAAMDKALRPLDLTVSQYACLELLRQQPGLSGSELARAMFVSRQSMNLVLKGLERRELLTRSPVPRHGKALPTELSPAGLAKLAAANEAVSVVEETMLAALTPEAERRMCADLTAFAAALTDLAGEEDPD
ncbi:MarR family transcriptional regulator [Couchioplanes caeruleus]|uniref:MarR family winged helix-turn-helix transcriptional regulator n=1 Tax=Couchioplanes caeruleus TaxID=56438 RepID=UPI0020BD5D68|nr:MarR family transcriptional regulator [Couchioplanes caeruleus]UQU66040.1 MarR family transcriptional regulator [Couchioplanes caeruleus]